MLLLKATLILVVGTVACAALRRASADARHRLWSWTFAALMLLPFLALALPPLHLDMPEAVRASLAPAPERVPAAERPAAVVVEAQGGADSGAGGPVETPAAKTAAAPVARVTLARVLRAVWLLGTLAALTALAISLVRVRHLARDATPVTDSAWRAATASLAERLGIGGDVQLLTSPRVSTPMAGGIWRPTVYLPLTAAQWDAEQRDVVLAHELAHLAARDPHRHLLARSALALYWFHPLAWLAARQATTAREQACDERVLALGTRASAYARVLLDLAESIQAPPHALATLPMVHRPSLEARVMAILKGTHRTSATHRGLIPVLGITGLTLVIAAVSPGAAPVPAATRWVDASPDAGTRPPSSAPTPAASTSRPVAPEPSARQSDTYKAGDCWGRFSDGESFAGRTAIASGGTIVRERVGTVNDAHRVILFTLNGIRLCAVGESIGPADSTDPPSRWIGRARRVVLESTTGSDTYTMLFAGAQPPQWQVNGVARTVDGAADDWRARMLAALDARWEATVLRGQQTSLRGEITSIRGRETSLRGEITSLRGQVTSMLGRITSIRGEETSMRGRITSIRGHETSLRGQITTARGAITSINANYRSADSERRISDYERQIEQIEREIRDYNADAKVAAIEKEIDAFDADRKVAEVEKQIEAFDLDKKVAEIERRIADLKVADNVEDIEGQIEKLDVERRVAAIGKRIDEAAAQLKTAIAAIK